MMDAASKPLAINQFQLILDAAPPCAALGPKVKEEKSAISCCQCGHQQVNHRDAQPLSSGPNASAVCSQCRV